MQTNYTTTCTERQARGNRLVHEGKVTRQDGGSDRFFVTSQTGISGYAVDLRRRACDCPDNRHSGNICKHILAAETFARLAAERAAEHSRTEALRQRVNARIAANQAAW